MLHKLKNIIQNPKVVITILSVSLLLLLICYLKTETKVIQCQLGDKCGINGYEALEQLNYEIDSLKNEMFIKEIQIGSYEVMWGILEEVNPNLADSINLMVE